MAAPASATLKNLTGKWALNKTLSDSTDPALALQGVSYIARTGISYANISLDINSYEGPPKEPNTATDPVTHIDIEQSASGLSNTTENRCLDDTIRTRSDWVFGELSSRSKWVSLDEVEDEFLKQGWETEGDGKYVFSQAESSTNGWKATQVWGFKTINGERRYCRNVLVVKGSERVEVKMVYDYVSA